MAILDEATRKAHLKTFESLAHHLPGAGHAIAAEFALLERIVGILQTKNVELETRLKNLEDAKEREQKTMDYLAEKEE